jgi:tRNA pseudouridine38-40 synthase|tara:strand:+ start:326 stop:1186 length:861 start_codon:yes stop_codon:yes gene_type:complete
VTESDNRDQFYSADVGNSGITTRIALRVEYNGAKFSGWQKQKSPSLATVQGALELALSKVADSTIVVVCAGRTDSGVHATAQIVHFDTPINRGLKAWELGVNSLLPPTIRVTKALVVDDNFHARFSAVYRRYNYILHSRSIASALVSDLVTTQRRSLDVDGMNEGAQFLLGEQDFTSFRAAGCQSKTANRCVIEAFFSQRGEFLVFSICANAFLQHMVRNIMGSMLAVGGGDKSPQWIEGLLAAKDRSLAAITAPPQGLYLVEVGYPDDLLSPAMLVKPPVLASHN